MKRPKDGSCKIKVNILFISLLCISITSSCFAKNIHDILMPSKNTFDWLDRLDALESLESLESLENNSSMAQPDNQHSQNPGHSNNNSSNWLKEKTKTLRSFTRLEVSDTFTVKPGKIKARPLKLSDISEYYNLEEIGEQNEHTKSQRGYGVKFNYEFK